MTLQKRTSKRKQKQKKQTNNKKIWLCKICTFDNSGLLPYCEMCLNPYKKQQTFTSVMNIRENLKIHEDYNFLLYKQLIADFKRDIQKLQQLQSYLSSSSSSSGSNITHVDKDLKVIHQLLTEYNNNNNNSNNNNSSNKEGGSRYNSNAKMFKSQRKMHKKTHPVCKCGTEMKAMKSGECYTEHPIAICDICDTMIKNNEVLYHCPKQKKTKHHPQGFDICTKCSQKYIHRLRYFVAVIIAPPISSGNYKSQDAIALRKMFQKLGFHKIIYLTGENATKERIELALANIVTQGKERKKRNINQLNIICYSGHGAIKNDMFQFAIDDKNEDTWISAPDMISGFCRATVMGSVSDGMTGFFNKAWHKTYFRMNTVFLVNACSSGGAGKLMHRQRNADIYGIHSSYVLSCISSLGLSVALFLESIKLVSEYSTKLNFDCVRSLLNGVECRLDISPMFMIAFATFAGVSLFTAITILLSVKKSGEHETISLIASCTAYQDSNFVHPVSPFVQYVTQYFDAFVGNQNQNHNLNQKNEIRKMKDTPEQLFLHLQRCSAKPYPELGDMSLNEFGQCVELHHRGFQGFALCPILIRNNLQ